MKEHKGLPVERMLDYPSSLTRGLFLGGPARSSGQCNHNAHSLLMSSPHHVATLSSNASRSTNEATVLDSILQGESDYRESQKTGGRDGLPRDGQTPFLTPLSKVSRSQLAQLLPVPAALHASPQPKTALCYCASFQRSNGVSCHEKLGHTCGRISMSILRNGVAGRCSVLGGTPEAVHRQHPSVRAP